MPRRAPLTAARLHPARPHPPRIPLPETPHGCRGRAPLLRQTALLPVTIGLPSRDRSPQYAHNCVTRNFRYFSLTEKSALSVWTIRREKSEKGRVHLAGIRGLMRARTFSSAAE